jgi:hypothetical protein
METEGSQGPAPHAFPQPGGHGAHSLAGKRRVRFNIFFFNPGIVNEIKGYAIETKSDIYYDISSYF